MLTKA